MVYLQVDFPGVTVCNLNRVNCHNAFMAAFNITSMLKNTDLSDEEKVCRIRSKVKSMGFFTLTSIFGRQH